MASSFLGKSPNSFTTTNIAAAAAAALHHRPSSNHHHHHQNGDMEYDDDEKASSSPTCSSVAPAALCCDDLLADSSEAAMALSSLIELGKSQQQMHRDAAVGSDNCDHRGVVVGCPSSSVSAVDAPTVASSPSYADAATALNTVVFVQNLKTEDNESGDELPPQDDSAASDAPVHEIRCGLLNARLHMQRFTCPGIHRKCVEFEGKLISPRQFTIKAEKDKQKDWKGSIRLGKHNLRTLMEMKTIDFYEHATNCSLKCQSRNYIKNRKSEGAGGGDSTTASFDTLEEPKASSNSGAFDYFGDANEIHSTTSSASTRKSSAVLEDFVSQTIPSVNGPFVPLNLGTFCMNNNVGEEHKQTNAFSRSGEMATDGEEKPSLLLGMGGTGGRSSATAAHFIGSNRNSPSSVPTTSSSVAFPPLFGAPPPSSSNCCTTTTTGNNGIAAASVAPQTSPLSFVPSFALLQQQSPLKQLFTSLHHNSHKQQQQLTTALCPASSVVGLPHQQQQNNIKTSTVGGAHSVGGVLHAAELNQQQQENNGAGNGTTTTNTLALLLQSLQTSILMEQHQKAILNSNSTTAASNGTNNLTAFLNRIPSLNGGGSNNHHHLLGAMSNGAGGGAGTTTASIELAALHRHGAALTAEQPQQPMVGANRLQQQQSLTGIERLLNAAALIPQLQPFQQQQPQHHRMPQAATAAVKQQEGHGGAGGNVRKVMEENAVLFWSQMRSMGLLDDFLSTLGTALERLKHIYVNGGNAVSEEFAARRLSGVALALDLCTVFGDKIHNRCIQATLETNLITKELLELQRKQEEQKRRLESAKRKSQMFELLKNGNGGGGTREDSGSAESPPEIKKIHLNI